MCSSPRGRAVIISNENFAKASAFRGGSAIDVLNLRALFTQLDFQTFTHTDLTAQVRILVLHFFSSKYIT